MMNKEFCWFMDGWQEASGADEASDGAWQAMMMEGVVAYNEEEKTDYDPHGGWLYWVENREQDNETNV